MRINNFSHISGQIWPALYFMGTRQQQATQLLLKCLWWGLFSPIMGLPVGFMLTMFAARFLVDRLPFFDGDVWIWWGAILTGLLAIKWIAIVEGDFRPAMLGRVILYLAPALVVGLMFAAVRSIDDRQHPILDQSFYAHLGVLFVAILAVIMYFDWLRGAKELIQFIWTYRPKSV